jgi:hypothetical protein
MALARALLHPAAKPLLFAASLLPFAWLFYGAIADKLGANPRSTSRAPPATGRCASCASRWP